MTNEATPYNQPRSIEDNAYINSLKYEIINLKNILKIIEQHKMSKFTTEIDTLELQQLQARAALTEGFGYSNDYFKDAANFLEDKAEDYKMVGKSQNLTNLVETGAAFTEIAKMLRDIGNFK